MIAVVILNYMNYDDTIKCIGALSDSKDIAMYVVDNNSPDGSGDKLRQFCEGFPMITFIESESNNGYAAGNNIGIKIAENNKDIDYICVLNNDVIVKPEELKKLADFLQNNSDYGIVGPSILEMKNKELIQSEGASINLWKGDVSPNHHGMRYQPNRAPFSCAYISGCCMMFRKDDIHTIGYIPEDYFLYFEETEWCLRATRMGIKVACLPSACAYHAGSATTAKQSGLSSYLLMRNRAFFEKRNANKAQVCVFLIHNIIHIIGRTVVKRNNEMWKISAMVDGLVGRINKEYSYIPL